MSDEQPKTAKSHSYRRPALLERTGDTIGRLLGDSSMRWRLRNVYRRLLGIATRGGPRSVLPHGEVVRMAPEFRFVTWNPVEYEAFRAVLRPGDTALDVGANVGPYAILFGIWAGPQGRVVAFEPAAAAYEGLCRHLALNGLTGHVRALRVAVSDTVGEAEFVGEGFQGTNRLRGGATADASSRTIRVPTTTIDEVCRVERLQPRLIKIDVEGAELAVLRGARETIARMAADGGLFVEMHPVAWRATGITVDDVRDELSRQQLSAVPLRANVDPWSLDGECMRLVRG
jgi:FkbM family methyltransferase